MNRNDDVPILDRARLELITRGNVELAGEFLDALFEEVDALLVRLKALIGGSDRVAVSDVAHTIKGNATELGAMRLRSAAAFLETAEHPAQWPGCVERLYTALDELQAHVKPEGFQT
jgi:HPt (histidine-containing phosphotransfer) domain-containing protein